MHGVERKDEQFIAKVKGREITENWELQERNVERKARKNKGG